MTFPIEEGVVEVTAEIDRNSVRAAAAGAGKQAGEELEKSTRESFDRSTRGSKTQFSNILKRAVTPSPDAFAAIRAPFAAALSTPIGAAVIAVAGTAALAFVGAFATALATAGLGGVFLAIGIAAVAGNKRLQNAFGETVNTLKRTFSSAARPLIDPLIRALGIVQQTIRDIGPELNQIFTVLAGAIEPLTRGMSGFVTEFLRVLTADPAALAGMRDALIAIGENLPKVGAALGELFARLATNENNVRNIGLLFDLLVFSINSVGASLLLLSSTLDYIVAGWNKVIAVTQAVVAWLSGPFASGFMGVVNAIGGFFTSIPGWISGAWTAIVTFFQNLWTTVSTFTVNLVTGIIGFFTALPGRIMSAVAALPGMLVSFFVTTLSAVAFAVGFAIGSIIKFWIDLPGRIVAAISALPGLVASIFNSVRSTATSVVSSLVSSVVSFFSQLPGRAYSAAIGIVQRIASVFQSARSTAVSTAGQIVSSVVSTLAQLPGRAASAVQSVGSRIAGALRSAIGQASSIGRQIIQGLINGIQSMAGAAVSAAKRVVQSAINGAKSALGIGSPSKVFAQIGTDTLAGLVRGLGRTQIVSRAMAGVTDALTDGMPSGSLGFTATGRAAGVAPVTSAVASAGRDSSSGGGGTVINLGGVQLVFNGAPPENPRAYGEEVAAGIAHGLSAAALAAGRM